MGAFQLSFVFLALVLASSCTQVNKKYLKKNSHLHAKGVPYSSFYKKQAVCDVEQFHCHDGGCINGLWECDMDKDCEDGSDELNCPTDCTGEHQLQCHNGYCLAGYFHCDGYDDCGDNSDELDCHLIQCEEGQVKCPNHRCIQLSWVCDGANDCGDGWDESNCTSGCNFYQFECADQSRCIPLSWQCDGGADCPDESDERNCVCDPVTQWQCDTGRCININWRCDHDNDCGDLSDELGCPTLHPSICSDLLSMRACALMNETTHPICLTYDDGHKYCRKYCDLCQDDVTTHTMKL
ncbi:low-density lipoprotein receptor-related protein 4-like [Physella acuta]|uniref:low-density lipoprotein receptor-related protein 4-like n=1 Tax=Physella acuta TaxID=109671 RepID=UPI0027DC0913|nr:low-density lipoprotein receptor-related protein 4-like [Physella acuta]